MPTGNKKLLEVEQKRALSDAAREARNKAAREWRKRNKEKVREYARRYWEKRAAIDAVLSGQGEGYNAEAGE